MADVKLNLRLDVGDEDDTTSRLIAAARGMAENRLVRRLIDSTWDYVLPRFPGNSNAHLELPFPPLDSVTSVTYFDSAGTSTTWSSALYTVTKPAGDNAGLGSIVPIDGETYPSTQSRIDAVTVRYVAGYGSAETDVPQDIQTGMHFLISHWFENREAVATSGAIPKELPLAVAALWDDYISER